MPRITVVRNPDAPKSQWQYEDIDLCVNCYPPDADDLAGMTGVSVEWAAAAIEDAGYLGHFHEDYDECEWFCAICHKPLDNSDN